MAASNPTNEAELAALLVAELKELCKANGLSHVGKKAELQGRLRAHLLAPSGAGGSLGGGSIAGSSSGSVAGGSISGDGAGGTSFGNGPGSPGRKRTPAQQVAFNCDAEVEELVLKVLPDRADNRAHSVVGGWLVEAFTKMTGKEVTMQQLSRAKFTFTGTSGEKTFIGVRVPGDSEDYCPLLTEVTKRLVACQPLPVGLSVDDAEAAVDDMLSALRAKDNAGPVKEQKPAMMGVDLGKAFETMVASLRGGVAPTPKYEAAEFSAAQQHMRMHGFCLDARDCPRLSQVALAKKSVLAMDGLMNVPLLPMESQVQPGMLKAIVDQRTGLHNRDVSQRVGLEGGRLSVVDVEEVVPKKGRSAYEVCHGYTMYWVMVAVLSTQITNLSPNYRGPGAGKFLHPYYVHKFMNAMRHIVGASGLSGDALDAILGQLLQNVQARCNEDTDRPWTGDECVSHMCDEVPKQVALARSLTFPQRGPRSGGDGDGRRGGRPGAGGGPRQVRCVGGIAMLHECISELRVRGAGFGAEVQLAELPEHDKPSGWLVLRLREERHSSWECIDARPRHRRRRGCGARRGAAQRGARGGCRVRDGGVEGGGGSALLVR